MWEEVDLQRSCVDEVSVRTKPHKSVTQVWLKYVHFEAIGEKKKIPCLFWLSLRVIKYGKGVFILLVMNWFENGC